MLRVVSAEGVSTHAVTIPKPRIRWLNDEYAQQSGKPWACSHAGFISRGASPKAAYDSLQAHFVDMRKWGANAGRSILAHA